MKKKHLSAEQLLSMYYDGHEGAEAGHLDACPDCRTEFERMKTFLDDLRDFPVPHRSSSTYGAEVWSRLQPKLPTRRETVPWFSWRWLGPAFAAVAIVAFFAGMLTVRHQSSERFNTQARSRVLLIAMSDHLDRSQMVLAELVNANPQGADWSDEQARARDLLAENRLLRQTASRTVDPLQASVLDQLERVLMDLANAPSNPSPAELEGLQQRIESEGLRLKVHIVGANARQRGQKL